MKKYATLFEQGGHRWTIFYFDDVKANHLVATNEYLVQHNDKYLMTDPGGTETFPEVISALGEVVDIKKIDQVFCTHQDPDIFSAIALWLMMKPNIQVYLPSIWISFMLHFGGQKANFIPLHDEGTILNLNGLDLQVIPAHFMHSSGNFHLYDPVAKVLFTGDTGAGLISNAKDFVVRDFDKHIQHIEGFHKRWFGSNEHKNQWCERVKNLGIDFLCPQHGLIYEGAMVETFLDWLYNLRVGIIEY